MRRLAGGRLAGGGSSLGNWGESGIHDGYRIAYYRCGCVFGAKVGKACRRHVVKLGWSQAAARRSLSGAEAPAGKYSAVNRLCGLYAPAEEIQEARPRDSRHGLPSRLLHSIRLYRRQAADFRFCPMRCQLLGKDVSIGTLKKRPAAAISSATDPSSGFLWR